MDGQSTSTQRYADGRTTFPSKHPVAADVNNHQHHKHMASRSLPSPPLAPSSTTQSDASPPPTTLSKDNCDRRRPDEEEESRLVKVPVELVGQMVTPFLREHIPGLYAPIGKAEAPDAMKQEKNPNTRFCYRHRPDSKCRRAADESKMELIQHELDRLSTADQAAITHVWSLFSAAPSRHRDLMLQGILTQCCFPQLSTVSREVHEQLKIDFLAALPAEISYRVLGFLDAISLCKAAQVSRRWRSLADDDHVWHRMCEQHIHRKCTKCGWGLPLLEQKRLRNWARQQQLAQGRQILEEETEYASTSTSEAVNELASSQAGPSKRKSPDPEAGSSNKRQCVNGVKRRRPDEERNFKTLYRDRFKIGNNWKHGRCSIRIFQGHSNGVTCLQFDDNVMATGSYDCTIKIWDLDSGKVVRTLHGHQQGIRTLQFNEAKLVSGSLDGEIKIWNWQTGECVQTLRCHQNGVISVHFDGEYLVSGSADKTVKVINYETRETYTLRGHQDFVNHVRIDATSRTLFTASDDCTVKLWDLDTKECIRTYEGHVGQVQQVLPMPDDFEPEEEDAGDVNADAVSISSSSRSDTGVASAANNHQFASAATAFPASLLGAAATSSSSSASDSGFASNPPDDRACYGPGFINDPTRPLPPRYMLTGSLDTTVRLFSTASGKCLKPFFGHVEGIWGLVGDTLRIVTGAQDGMVKIWNPSGRCERTFTGHKGAVTCVGLSDSRLASGSDDGEVRLYSFEGEGRVEECGTPS